MAGIVIALSLSAVMLGAIWLLLKPRRRAEPERQTLPGQLSAAERRQLYHRLGIDPAAMARQRRSNVIWLDPRIDERRPSTRA